MKEEDGKGEQMKNCSGVAGELKWAKSLRPPSHCVPIF